MIVADEPEPIEPQEIQTPSVPDSYYVFRLSNMTEALPWFWQKVIWHLWRRYKWVPLVALPELTEDERELLSWDPATLDYDRVRDLHRLASTIAFRDVGYYNPHAQTIKCGRCRPKAKQEALALCVQAGWGYHQLPTESVLPTPAMQVGIHEYPMSAHIEEYVTEKPIKPFYWDKQS